MTRTIGCALDTATATTRIWTRRASPSLSLFLSLSSSLVVTVLSFSSSRSLLVTYTLSLSLSFPERDPRSTPLFSRRESRLARGHRTTECRPTQLAHTHDTVHEFGPPLVDWLPRLTSRASLTRSFVRSLTRSLTRRSVSPPHLAFPTTLRCVRSFCDDKTRAGSQTADGGDLPAAAYFMHGATRMTTTATRYLTNAYRNGNKTYIHTHIHTLTGLEGSRARANSRHRRHWHSLTTFDLPWLRPAATSVRDANEPPDCLRAPEKRRREMAPATARRSRHRAFQRDVTRHWRGAT